MTSCWSCDMTDFPHLRTGAVTQYPSSRKTTYSTSVTMFVDGTEQRFRELGHPVRTWIIRMQRLSAEEIGAVETFFKDGQGSLEAFSSPTHGMGRVIQTAALIRKLFQLMPWA